MKKFKTLLAAAFVTATLFASSMSFAQEADDPPPPRPCDLPGAENCAPMGGSACTANGCYQFQCNAAGCVLIFTPANPFKQFPKER